MGAIPTHIASYRNSFADTYGEFMNMVKPMHIVGVIDMNTLPLEKDIHSHQVAQC